jgi:hypothetical protein
MAYLFTNHDKYHLHKTLGLLAFCNFILRFYYAIIYGTSFPTFESKVFSCSCVLIHALLPIASLSIRLPEKRNFSSPMIWKEFQLHSILFSCRHVLFTIITLLELWPTQIPAYSSGTRYRARALLCECIIKYLVIIGFIKGAAVITEKYGDKEKRTTNAMPYPLYLTEYEKTRIKYEYAKKQFGATILAVFSGELASSLNFAPLYAIQSAPFMMTLVRKGKCEMLDYHRVYSATLLYPLYLYHVILRGFCSQFADFVISYLYTFSYTMRIKYNWHNMKMWAIVIPAAVIALNIIPDIEKRIIAENNFTNFLRYFCSIYLIYKEILCDYYIYKPFARTISLYRVKMHFVRRP